MASSVENDNFRDLQKEKHFWTILNASMELDFKKGFLKCSPVLLEPYMSIEITTPEEYVGDVVGDICSRRGKILGMEIKGNQQVVSSEAPLSEMFGYATSLRSLSQGRATYSMQLSEYEDVPPNIQNQLVAGMGY